MGSKFSMEGEVENGPYQIELQLAFITSSNLSLHDLYVCSQCCWSWFRAISSKELWTLLCQRDYPNSKLPPSKEAYKAIVLHFTGVDIIDDFLSNNRLTYPGYLYGIVLMNDYYFNFYREDLDKLKKNWILWRGPLDDSLHLLKIKQSAYIGDRSDKNLASIDKYKNLKLFSYAGISAYKNITLFLLLGWESDLADCEETYLSFGTYHYKCAIKKMKNRQESHCLCEKLSVYLYHYLIVFFVFINT